MNSLWNLVTGDVVQGSVAIAVAYAACRILRVPPTVRCWIWRAVYLKLLLGLIALPPLSLPLLAPRTSDQAAIAGSYGSAAPDILSAVPKSTAVQGVAKDTQDRRVAPAVVTSNTQFAGGVGSVVKAEPIRLNNTPAFRPSDSLPFTNAAGHPPLTLTLVLTVVWFAGVLLGCVRVARSWFRTRGIRRRSLPAPDELVAECADVCRSIGRVKPPPVRVLTALSTPLLTGIARPTVLVPVELLAPGRTTERRSVLAHEIAHFVRRDLLWRWLPICGRIAFFFNPLVWLAEREWDLAVEMAADALAVSATRSSVTDYGAMVLRFSVGSRPVGGQLTTAIGGSRFVLKERLSALEYVGAFSHKTVVRSGIVALTVALFLILPWRLVPRGSMVIAAVRSIVDLSADQAAITHTEIAGLVETPEGAPAPGAQVLWVDHGRTLESTTSNSSGRFVFSDADAILGKNPQALRSGIVARQAGYADGVRDLEAPLTAFVIKMWRPAQVTVDLVDTRGAPVSGVPITLGRLLPVGADGDADFGWVYGSIQPMIELPAGDRNLSGVSDATGSVTFSGLPIGASGLLELGHGMLASNRSQFRVDIDKPVIALKLTVYAGATIRGKVVSGADGAPVNNARVDAGYQGGLQSAQHEGVPQAPEPATTGSDGNFILTGVPAGPYLISLRPDMSDPQMLGWREFSVNVHGAGYNEGDFPVSPVTPGHPAALENVNVGDSITLPTITLPAIGRVDGRVTTPDGRPAMTNVTIQSPVPSAFPAFSASSGTTRTYYAVSTLADGRFSTNVGPGSYLVTAGTEPVLKGVPITVRAGKDVNVDLVSDGSVFSPTMPADTPHSSVPGTTWLNTVTTPVQGTVVDATGRPVAGAIVHGFRSTGLGGTAATDSDGRFTVDADPNGTIWASSGSLASPEVSAGGTTPISLVIGLKPQTASVDGAIVDMHGTPVAGAVVRLYGLLRTVESTSCETYTDQTGHFDFAGLRPNNDFRLSVSSPGLVAPVDLVNTAVNAVQGKMLVMKPIEMAAQTGFLDGRLVDRQGNAIADAELDLRGPHTARIGIRTARDGQFHFIHFADEPISLVVISHGKRTVYKSAPDRSNLILKDD